jgi:aryl-alcohol dehydrogenase-like predicted oxidoreductase
MMTECRKLGATSIDITPISLGTWVFGGDSWGGADDSDSERVILEAVEAGVNFIDTAPAYGNGRSEEVVGKALAGKRNHTNIATKCGLEITAKGVRINLSPEFLRTELENSLRRLRVEHIDLYQLHWPDKNTPIESTISAMLKFVEEGKVRHIGVCNFDDVLLDEAGRYVEIVSNQVHYSVFNRQAEEKVIPYCGKKGISVLAYGTLGGGILSGKYKEPPVFPKNDVRSFFYKFYKEPFFGKARSIAAFLEEIARVKNVAPEEVALNYVLADKTVAAALSGCRTSAQLRKNIAAASWSLSGAEYSAIIAECGRVFGKSSLQKGA